ncbi:MAG: TolC family protein [Dehalobacterium sp.]
MSRIVNFKICIVICILTIFCFKGDIFAETVSEAEQEQVKTISLEEAINLTLANNMELKILEKQIAARKLDLDRANFYRNKLIDADGRIDDGWTEYNENRNQLDTLKDLIDFGVITPGHPLYLTEDEIAQKEALLDEAEEELRSNAQYRIDNLANAQVVELYQTKAALGFDVTKLGVEEARKQYALLTRQLYYNVLKNQRLVNVKQSAVERGENQYQLAAQSFQAGFRAKDDMLMAEAQLSLIKADLANARNDLSLSKIELNQVMGLNPEIELELADDFTFKRDMIPLTVGLEQALKNRIEIKKGEMEEEVCRINMELAKRYTAPNTFDYRQIQLDLDNALLSLEEEKQSVLSEVYGSYQTVIAAGEMLDYVNESVDQAKEALDIATYRYQEGYGIPSSVLKSLNMEDAGGTIFEVFAAQEKLCEIEDKVVEISYGYNLAKSKYEVDICADEK